jgi:hypothetical protein
MRFRIWDNDSMEPSEPSDSPRETIPIPPSNSKVPRRLGFGVIFAAALFCANRGFSSVNAPPSWIAGSTWFAGTVALLIIAIFFWEHTEKRHWGIRLGLSGFVIVIVSALAYGPITKEYGREHAPQATASQPVKQEHSPNPTPNPTPNPRPVLREPYPWVSFSGTLVDNNGNVSVRPQPQVSDYPTPQSNRDLLSVASLPNVHVQMSVPFEVREDVEGWHSCVLVNVTVPVWSNESDQDNPFSPMPIDKDLIVIQIRLSMGTGVWDSLVIIRRINGHLDIKQYISGRFLSPLGEQQSMSVRRTSTDAKTAITDNVTVPHMTKQLLIGYQLPVRNMSVEELNAQCPHLMYTQEVHNQKHLTIPESTHGIR